MDRLAPLPTIVPLIGAALAMLVMRWPTLQRAIAVVGLSGALAMSIALLVDVDRNGPAVARIGGWSPLIGVSYVIDTFAAIMLVVGIGTLLAVLVFAFGERSASAT